MDKLKVISMLLDIAKVGVQLDFHGKVDCQTNLNNVLATLLNYTDKLINEVNRND